MKLEACQNKKLSTILIRKYFYMAKIFKTTRKETFHSSKLNLLQYSVFIDHACSFIEMFCRNKWKKHRYRKFNLNFHSFSFQSEWEGIFSSVFNWKIQCLCKAEIMIWDVFPLMSVDFECNLLSPSGEYTMARLIFKTIFEK